jgi:hypothetical protein
MAYHLDDSIVPLEAPNELEVLCSNTAPVASNHFSRSFSTIAAATVRA